MINRERVSKMRAKFKKRWKLWGVDEFNRKYTEPKGIEPWTPYGLKNHSTLCSCFGCRNEEYDRNIQKLIDKNIETEEFDSVEEKIDE